MMVRQAIAFVASVFMAVATNGVASAAGVGHGAAVDAAPHEGMIERGRYIVRIAGCNDCHTPGYAQTGGQVAERDWLVGDRLGWHGPWGTTYPVNLRILLAQMSEDEWLRVARTAQARPPMPWFALRDMADNDLRAIHRFVRSLGVAGEPAPPYMPPGRQPDGVAVLFPMPPR